MNPLADQVMGLVLAPRDERYDAERAGWQTARQHRPDLVVSAVVPADVQAAVTYASSHGLPTAVRGTGHASAADVFGTYLRWAATVPDAMNSSIALISLPDCPSIPEPLRGRHTVQIRIACATGDPGPGERLVAPLGAIGPLSDTLGQLAYAEAGSIHNDPVAPGAVESDTAMLGELDATAVRAILDLAGPHPPVPHVVELRHLGGKLAQPPAVPNAVGTGGRFLNFMNGENAATHVRSAYSPADYQRLTDLKAVYDPQNTFRLNHNIPPGQRPTPK